MAKLFVANGYGFGKYWTGNIFVRALKDPYAFYLGDGKMAILSAQPDDEDGERQIIAAADTFTKKELLKYFPLLDFGKISNIDWLKPVNVMLICNDESNVRDSLVYYTWPAVDLHFVKEIGTNALIVYDRFTPQDLFDSLQKEADVKGITAEVEYWSMVKLLAIGDRFGELAPAICLESIKKKLQ
jgi:hypothetical protein